MTDQESEESSSVTFPRPANFGQAIPEMRGNAGRGHKQIVGHV